MNNRVIATSAVVTVGVGSTNSILRNEKLPSARFLIGCGVAFLILSALADMGEDEIAKAFAVAIATTVVLGEGGGVLSYLNNGEMDTHKRDNHKSNARTPADAVAGRTPGVGAPILRTPILPFPNMN